MKLFPSNRSESLKSRLWRLIYNLLPLIRGTGSRLTFLSGDWHEAHLRLGMNLRTRNYAGTIFGGAMFSAADPVYFIQLYNLLGNEYILWDKAAKIQFLRPGQTALKAIFHINSSEIDLIKRQLATHPECEHTFYITWLDQHDRKVATIHKNIYIAQKAYYKQKRAS